ncbi:UvrD-helicase domain-containing protein [Clostridium oryzae]|uniref:ATP-dependent DNA helicase PcrA n=1 Tax=Clostridium oryzae TaxID=1450648 RepID=A0A1V4IRB5_9CLOT|nr:UvrD-helicase domain-containing protein [Clostridium oryzae]OPJ62568.1 ATP-dependent DNA helicase PcrA [Clostridium oryzae]
MKLSPVQKQIVKLPGNLIVRASAGTGKTHTMVSKITYDIGQHHSHKVIAAITFTIKAAREIKNRLTIDIDRQFIGTNNSFAIEEIIKPFMKDVYGNDYKVDMSTDYSAKVRTFQEGIDKIRVDKVLCSYKDNKKNFIFQLALDILKKSKVCQLYLQAKYFKIYVDEYQDCDKDMHEFFMYICEKLQIDTFVVGDEKQSIYIWRGAYPDAFLSIWKREDFNKEFMGDNFRSCQQIQNYSNLLCKETRGLYKKVTNLQSIYLINTTKAKWMDAVLEYIDTNEKTALLRYSKLNAKEGADKLSLKGTKFVYIPPTPIADITTDVAWLYNAIANYFIVDTYSAYDLLEEVPDEAIGNKKVVSYVKKTLAVLDECIKKADIDNFEKQMDNFASYFSYNTKREHIDKLYTTIVDESFHPAFNVDQLNRIAITFHSSKGLEFEQVIVFASDYRLSDAESIYNHYVAVTRAKTKLIIINLGEYNDNIYHDRLESIFGDSQLRIEDVVTVVDRR